MTQEPDLTKPLGWHPISSSTSRGVFHMFGDDLERVHAQRVDAGLEEGGHNNFWGPTNEIGVKWRNSSNKFKWKSKLQDSIDLSTLKMKPSEDSGQSRDIKDVQASMLLCMKTESYPNPKVHSVLKENNAIDVVQDVPFHDEDDSAEDPPPAKKPKFKFGFFTEQQDAHQNTHEPQDPLVTNNYAGIPEVRPQTRYAPVVMEQSRKASGRRFGLPGIAPRRNLEQQGEESEKEKHFPIFRTAGQQLADNVKKKNNHGYHYGASSKTLGSSRSSMVQNGFKPPVLNANHDDNLQKGSKAHLNPANEGDEIDERLKNVDPKMVELIKNEIMDCGNSVDWDDIAGLEFVKSIIKEIVVFPMLRPDIFTGLKAPPKGILLFGPPGTGKTLIGKCIASKSRSTFFAISASSLTSKWIGEGEKMVRALFAVARVHQPSVVFIDEIDSLLTARSDTEHESSRRLKTEFLVQLDGATTEGEERILIVGATNRPQDLDEAARRRLVKRLYVPLPEKEARRQIIQNLMRKENQSLSMPDIEKIVSDTEGYSGADMAHLCKDAAMGPVRDIDYTNIETISSAEIRPIRPEDFEKALKQVRASVSDKDLVLYANWNGQYGSGK